MILLIEVCADLCYTKGIRDVNHLVTGENDMATHKAIITDRPEDTSGNRESDGRFALKMESKRSVNRWMKRDAQRQARRLELEAEFGDMADCFA